MNKPILKPNYYDKFVCIAGKCPITCCREWKIEVDDAACKKWKKTPNILKGRENTFLSSEVIEKEDRHLIQLDVNKQCPYLDEQKLCRLVLTYGEEMLSDTCHLFPRQVTEFSNRIEQALVTCCPAVIDLLKETEKTEKTDWQWMDGKENRSLLFVIRQNMMQLFLKKEYDIGQVMLVNFYLLLENYHAMSGHDKRRNALKIDWEEEICKEIADAVSRMEVSFLDTFLECNELFLDMVENYRKEGLYTEFLKQPATLAQILSDKLSEDTLEEAWVDRLQDAFFEFMKELSAYDSLLRNVIVCDLFSDLLVWDSDLESVVVMTQWQCLCFVTFRQALFLQWISEHGILFVDEIQKENNFVKQISFDEKIIAAKKSKEITVPLHKTQLSVKEITFTKSHPINKIDSHILTYERVRESLVIIARMTGYDQADIFDYLENSFADLIWEWGYMALLVKLFPMHEKLEQHTFCNGRLDE